MAAAVTEGVKGVRAEDAAGMKAALDLASRAYACGEVPVGAVVVRNGQVVGRGFNQPIGSHDASAHAEIQAIRDAGKTLGNYRLNDCTLYVTLEPCAMCAGAIMNARFARLVYGASEPKTGAAGSVIDLFSNPNLNHHTTVEAGMLSSACSDLLARFFADRRAVNQQQAIPLREDALRTPAAAFEPLKDFDYPRHCLDEPDLLQGLRLEYIDVGPREAAKTWLLIHPAHGWSASWRHWVEPLLALGYRVVIPDLIGFGRSDKPKKETVHTPEFQSAVLRGLVSAIDADSLRVVFCNDTMGLHMAQTAPALKPSAGAWLIAAPSDHRSPEALSVDALPYVDQGHAAALRATRRWSKPAIDMPSRFILSSLPYQLYDLDPQTDAHRRTALLSALAI
jgi:tRNA(adenine34) deaminase